jgi:hypothetical protein
MKKSCLKATAYAILVIGLAVGSGCVACLPQHPVIHEGPVSACYPSAHDPCVPLDHNPSVLNPWDLMSSVFRPFLYGPPR